MFGNDAEWRYYASDRYANANAKSVCNDEKHRRYKLHISVREWGQQFYGNRCVARYKKLYRCDLDTVFQAIFDIFCSQHHIFMFVQEENASLAWLFSHKVFFLAKGFTSYLSGTAFEFVLISKRTVSLFVMQHVSEYGGVFLLDFALWSLLFSLYIKPISTERRCWNSRL